MKRILFTLAILSLAVGLRSEDKVDAQIHHQWRKGFIGKFYITPDEPILEGWRLTVTFSKPVKKLKVWQAKVVSENDEKTEFVLENLRWNAKLREGKQYAFNFKCQKADKGIAPSVEVSFERLGEGSGLY